MINFQDCSTLAFRAEPANYGKPFVDYREKPYTIDPSHRKAEGLPQDWRNFGFRVYDLSVQGLGFRVSGFRVNLFALDSLACWSVGKESRNCSMIWESRVYREEGLWALGFRV